jgi:sterol desaturase/sphingolipid hydroxylase (fatty acid hydroxylase superfamily)
MNVQFLGMSLYGVVVAVAISILFAELAGYILHRVMHSERFTILSRTHLIHHLQLYGPTDAMRADAYKNATDGRTSLGNIGMEWVLPSVAILGGCWLALWGWGIGWGYQLLVMSTLLGWPLFMFSYLHDRMHLKNFWMERAPLLRIWFKKARRLHDVHHRSLNDDGIMNRNFGIGFFFFDRAFGTLAKRHRAMNWRGYRSAIRRHRANSVSEEERLASGMTRRVPHSYLLRGR